MTTAGREDLERQGDDLVRAANTLEVCDAPSFEVAASRLKLVKLYLGRVGEVMDPIVEAANKAHKVAVGQRNTLREPAVRAEAIYKDKMATYEREQRRRQQEAEEAARREQQRLEAEERARVEAERQRLAKEAEEKRLQEALAAEQRGDHKAADKLIEAPVVVPPVAARPVFAPPAPVMAPPKVEGVSFREEWSAEVYDLMELVKAIAAGQQPITLVKADQVALNGIARSMRDAMRIPGVKAVSRRGVAVRG